MRVVIDTHVFLDSIVPQEQDVYNAFIEKCHVMVVNTKIKNEYTGRAWSHGYRVIGIMVALMELEEKGKVTRKGMSACKRIEVNNEEIKRDAHLIQAAKAAHAKYVITQDWTDLLAYRDKIKREYEIEVLTPDRYVAEPIPCSST